MEVDTQPVELFKDYGSEGFLPEDAVAIRESDGAAVIYVIPRHEYGETMDEAITRAARIARFLTHNGTKQGKRDDQD